MLRHDTFAIALADGLEGVNFLRVLESAREESLNSRIPL
jgi:hypothetical protein